MSEIYANLPKNRAFSPKFMTFLKKPVLRKLTYLTEQDFEGILEVVNQKSIR